MKLVLRIERVAMRIRSAGGDEIRNVDEWLQYAKPKQGMRQWVDHRSAKECAKAWCSGNCPAEIAALLESHPDTKGVIVGEVTPERRIRFDCRRGEPCNADVAVVAEGPGGRIAIVIEAKVNEPFGRYVSEVVKNADDAISRGKPTQVRCRVKDLSQSLLPATIVDSSRMGDLRYQLLTGAAGAVAFAAEKKASRAVFIVHEFITDFSDETRRDENARDLDTFAACITEGKTTSLPPGRLCGPIHIPRSPLFDPAHLDFRGPLYIGKAVQYVRTPPLPTV